MKTETVPDPPPVVPIAANAHANRLARNADTTTPITIKPIITLSTQIDYRGRALTVTASGMTLDAFYAAVDTDDQSMVDCLFAISVSVRDGQRRTTITAAPMTIDGFCDLLDKKFGVPS